MTDVKIGIAPIGWTNDDLTDLGDHFSFETVISDISRLGYVGTEMGRKFPQDLNILKTRLQEKNITLISKFIGVLFSVPKYIKSELSTFKKWVACLSKIGCQYVIICEMGNSMHWDPRKQEPQPVIPLSDEQWQSLINGLHQAGEICNHYGLDLVYHHHAGTVIENEQDINRLMMETDPSLVHLLFDTGHAYYGGYDPEKLMEDHFSRIKYVHLKDVRNDVFKEVTHHQIDFRNAVRQGVFTVPGDGCINFDSILNKLIISGGYKGWITVEAEQDPELNDPVIYGRKAKEHIDNILGKL
jgi:inosose dehydratase